MHTGKEFPDNISEERREFSNNKEQNSMDTASTVSHHLSTDTERVDAFMG